MLTAAYCVLIRSKLVHRIKGYIQFDNLLTLFGTVPVAVNIV